MSEDPQSDDSADGFSSEEYKKFVMELISIYKEHPILWDKKHPCFRKNALRDKSWEELFKKFAEYYPDPTMELMKDKMENLRTVFRREYKKVQDARKNNTYYQPQLFYYNAFQFIIGDDEEEREDTSSPEYRQFILEFIGCLKQYPLLWDREDPDFWNSEERKLLYQELFKKFSEYYPDSTIEIMKGKLENLRTSAQKQYRKVQAAKKENREYQPNLFYYDALLFAVKGSYSDFNYEEYKQFVSEFLTLFRTFPILWDKEHPDFARPLERVQPYNELYLKFSEFYPNSSMDEMKEKLENFRTVFLRVHKKVQAARENGVECKPNLFYYNLLLFTVKEEENVNSVSEDIENSMENEQRDGRCYLYWSKEHTAALIELMKKYPEIHKSQSNKTGTMEAYRNLTMDLMAATDKKFKTYEVKRKVRTLKNIFRRGCRKGVVQGRESNIWFYEQLAEFLPTPSAEETEKKTSPQQSEVSDSDTSIAPEADYPAPKRPKKEEENFQPNMSQLRTTIATKLREMPEDQRQYAEQLISEVMYSGLMEKLTGDSTIQF